MKWVHKRPKLQAIKSEISKHPHKGDQLVDIDIAGQAQWSESLFKVAFTFNPAWYRTGHFPSIEFVRSDFVS